MVIGGIFEESDTTDENKVPFLGDLPGIGYLFKTKTKVVAKQELLVFVTPRLMPERGFAGR